MSPASYKASDDLASRVMEAMTDTWNGVKSRVRRTARKTFEVFTAHVAQSAVEADEMLGRDASTSEIYGRRGDGIAFTPEIHNDEPSGDDW